MASLDLISILVSDYDEAIRFYVDVLGFDLVEDSPAQTTDGRPKRWVVVRPPNAETGLLLARADGDDQERLVGRQHGGRVGFFLRVDDFASALARLRAAGVVFEGTPRTEPYGQVVVFRDIAGNRWDLLGPAEGEGRKPGAATPPIRTWNGHVKLGRPRRSGFRRSGTPGVRSTRLGAFDIAPGEDQMERTQVRTATSADEAQMVHTIVAAFAADPMARWCWPTAQQYLTTMPAFALAFGGAGFAHEGAHCTNDYSGAALWLPPGVHLDEEAMGRIAEETVEATIRADLFAIMEQMATFHPSEPHWYLPLIGVDPARQGKGHGAALLTYALERCDREGCLAYLESSNPRNISLYQRHGFKVLGEIQQGTSPSLVPMLRTPR